MTKTLKRVLDMDDPTRNRFVGFIDLMGFKDYVARNSHQTIYKELKKVFTEFKKDSLEEHYYSDGYKFYIFSDSIIFFTESEEIKDMQEFLRLMRILTERLLNETLPFRGGIAYGKMTVDAENSIFFGQPLIDAFLLSEELLFYGVAVHHTAEKQIRKDPDFKKRFIAYKSPMKGGQALHNIISPFIRFYNKFKVDEIIDGYRLKTSGSLRRYIDNTKDYLEYSFDYQNKYEKSKK